MALSDTLCKKLLNVKNTVVTGQDFFMDNDGVNHLVIHARPGKRHEDECPVCHRKCPEYDMQSLIPRRWRSLDWSSTVVEVEYLTHRICCPEHGVHVADVPRAYPDSRFTKDFDLTVGWPAVYLPRSAVSEYMRIDRAAKGHGKTVLEQFYRQLTKEQLSTIKVVTGDGARWITDCVNEFTPVCERCVDLKSLHVVRDVPKKVTRYQIKSVKQSRLPAI